MAAFGQKVMKIGHRWLVLVSILALLTRSVNHSILGFVAGYGRSEEADINMIFTTSVSKYTV